MLPNFIIVGAPKAGTTSLYHYLSEHPEVFMSNPKEVNYFSKEEIEAQGLFYQDFKAKDLAAYKKLFVQSTGKKAIGEGSVSYLFYPETPQKIKKVLPEVKIIILLRNPIDRGYSHYLMDYRLGLVDLTYDEILFKHVKNNKANLYYQQYIELGLYYDQVKRYIETFGRNKVKIYLQEELRNNTGDVVDDLYDFLELTKSFKPNTQKEHNSFSMPKNNFIQKAYTSKIIRGSVSALLPDRVKNFMLNAFFEQSKKPQLSLKTRQHLLDLYISDIKKLEKLIDQNLSSWYCNA